MKRLRSRILGRLVDVDTEHRTATTLDGVTYTASELEALRGEPEAVITAVHAWKKVFRGTIVDGPGVRP